MCLAGCAGLTEVGARLPGAYCYVPDVPLWWLVLFYAALLVGLAAGVTTRYPCTALATLVCGLGLGLLLTFWPHRAGEFRCTFLAVGHGGCAVVETPGGQVLLYDVGTIAGPDLTRRHVAPFLWSRGIRRIDELILSHADLDHFNGIPDLVERFAIGQVKHTPTFAERDMRALHEVLSKMDEREILRRVVTRGEHWDADEVSIDVLHPPVDGPEGKENVRSMVLLLRHRNLFILLTGDLEDTGLDHVLALPPHAVHVLMAPHHGSARSNTPKLAAWATPKVIVMCQARSDNTTEATRVYAATKGTVLGTWPHGAVTVRQNAERAWVETFRTGRQVGLSGRSP
jgi:competence protein ComEC